MFRRALGWARFLPAACGGFAGFAQAIAGDARKAGAIVDELSKRFPSDTLINDVWVPLIRSEIEIGGSNPAKAIELLQAASPYERGFAARRIPNYDRGEAYLMAHHGKEATAEFQRILDNPGVCQTAPICTLSHLQLARARILSGDSGGARTAYQDFLALRKDADPDIPTLNQAKVEYAKLQ